MQFLKTFFSNPMEKVLEGTVDTIKLAYVTLQLLM